MSSGAGGSRVLHRFTGLPRWLDEFFGVTGSTVANITKLSGGAIQENWTIDAEISGKWHQWVLRTDSPSTLSTSLGRAQEYAILCEVFAAGALAPEPIALCEDTSVIGTPFFVMARAPGMAQASRIVRDPALDSFGGKLAFALGRQLATVHSIDLHLPALNFLPYPNSHPAQHRIDRYRSDLDQLPEGQPVLEFALNWLEDHQPKDCRIVLCHTDYRTGNYMVENGELTCILDWEFTSLSDPHEDAGWFSARCWRFDNPHLDAGGIADLDTFCQGYDSVSKHPLDQSVIAYWQVMAEVRWAVIALQQAHRNNSGQEISLELALTGLMVNEMEHNALQLIDKISRRTTAKAG